MYYLMNKDSCVLSFEATPKREYSEDVTFNEVQQYGKKPYGFNNITSWIESRKASKHNAHLMKIMKMLNCLDNEGFIRLTHSVGINDSFWIKSENEKISWKDVSLYRNQFDNVISKLAFEGTGLYGETFSSTSPELSCEGSFRKCFMKEEKTGEFGSDIFLYKRGGELGPGIEPYCEILASELAEIISPSAVRYELCSLHGKLASKCNIFSNEEIGYVSFSKLNKSKSYLLDDIWSYFEKAGFEQNFRELLVVDSLCLNQDRHSGNYGMLFNNDTLEIVGMAPVFDLNLSMLPYVEMDEFSHIGDKLFGYAPKLGNDFTRIGQLAMNDTIRDRLKDIADYSFAFRGDDTFTQERVKYLEGIVHKQAKAILSNEKLYINDVFYSQEAQLSEERRIQIEAASKLMNRFYDHIENVELSAGSFISVCDGSEDAKMFIENESYTLVIDFYSKNAILQQNMQKISFEELKENAAEIYKDFNLVVNELSDFLNDSKMDMFHCNNDKKSKTSNIKKQLEVEDEL